MLLVAEDEKVPRSGLSLKETPSRLGGEERHPRGLRSFKEIFPGGPAMPIKVRPVVQAGATQMRVVNYKTQRIDKMQHCACADTKATDGSRVLGNLWGN